MAHFEAKVVGSKGGEKGVTGSTLHLYFGQRDGIQARVTMLVDGDQDWIEIDVGNLSETGSVVGARTLFQGSFQELQGFASSQGYTFPTNPPTAE